MEPQITLEEAKIIGDQIGADWTKIDLEQFQSGLLSETSKKYFEADNTYESTKLTANMVLSHLIEIPDYYTRLQRMKDKAKWVWRRRNRFQEMKERYTKNVLLLRDDVAEWKNKIENFSREIPICNQQLKEVNFADLKKNYRKKAEKYEALWNQELRSIESLKAKIETFDSKAELEISKGRKRLRVRLLREKVKLSDLVLRFQKNFEEIKGKYEQFIYNAKHFPAEQGNASMVL